MRRSPALIDVVLGVAIAYLVLRTQAARARTGSTGRRLPALAIPGVVLGIGYLRTLLRRHAARRRRRSRRSGSSSCWRWRSAACPMRCAPATPRCSRSPSSLEEAAENLGATKARTVRRIVVPLMTGGMLAGFVTSFATAAVELSATLMLVQSQRPTRRSPTASTSSCSRRRAAGQAPRSASSRCVLVAVCTCLSHLRHRAQRIGGRKTQDTEDRDRPCATQPASAIEISGVNLVLRHNHVLKDVEPRDPAGRVLRLPRPLGLRQDHAAAPDRRLQPGRQRPRSCIGGEDISRPAAVEARRRHGVPVATRCGRT